MDPEQVPVNTFDAFLRDLLYWNLVVRVDEQPDGHHWQLADQADRRLEEIATESSAVAVEHMVYLDHRCDVCGFRRLTRIRDARYVCDECSTTIDQSGVVEISSAPPHNAREQRWRWRRRTA
jgi:ribosomal protein L37AE/L43A